MSTLLRILLAAVTAVLAIARELGRKDVIKSFEEENSLVREKANKERESSPKSKEEILDYLRNNRLVILFLFLLLSSCSTSSSRVEVNFDCSFIHTLRWSDEDQKKLEELLIKEPTDSVLIRMSADYISIKKQLSTCDGSKKDGR